MLSSDPIIIIYTSQHPPSAEQKLPAFIYRNFRMKFRSSGRFTRLSHVSTSFSSSSSLFPPPSSLLPLPSSLFLPSTLFSWYAWNRFEYQEMIRDFKNIIRAVFFKCYYWIRYWSWLIGHDGNIIVASSLIFFFTVWSCPDECARLIRFSKSFDTFEVNFIESTHHTRRWCDTGGYIQRIRKDGHFSLTPNTNPRSSSILKRSGFKILDWFSWMLVNDAGL